jgi:hypothetical protein
MDRAHSAQVATVFFGTDRKWWETLKAFLGKAPPDVGSQLKPGNLGMVTRAGLSNGGGPVTLHRLRKGKRAKSY